MRKLFRGILLSGVGCAALAALPALSAKGDTIAVGGTITGSPGATSLPAGSTLLASIINAPFTLQPGAVGTGTYTVKAFQESGGTIDIQVSVDSVTSGHVGSVTLSGFDNFAVDVGVLSESPTGVDDTQIVRTTDSIDFDFRPAEIQVGQTSDTYLIKTSSTHVSNAIITFQDGGVDFEQSFGVSAPLPSTASMGITMMAACGIAGAAMKLRRKEVVA